MTRTPRIWLGEQERKYSCGAASLKYALCVLGFSPREEDLRRLARTSTWRGTQTKHLVRAAKRFGVRPKVRHFLDDEWSKARTWLGFELAAGHPVILDVDGFEHYVVAVQMLGHHVVILDPEGGPLDGSAYARVVLCGDRRLKGWWLSGDEQGEPDAFRGVSLALDRPPPGPRLRFSAATVARYLRGRRWILDEYLIDCVEIANGAPPDAEMRALGDVVRGLARDFVVERVAHWNSATPGQIQMLKAHVEDIALAAEAMQLHVDVARVDTVATDVAAILTAMLTSPD